jgi:hypothetical protein
VLVAAVFFPIACMLVPVFFSITSLLFFYCQSASFVLFCMFSFVLVCSAVLRFRCSVAAGGIPFGAPLLGVKLTRLEFVFVFVVCHFSGLTPADAFTPSTNTCVTLHHAHFSKMFPISQPNPPTNQPTTHTNHSTDQPPNHPPTPTTHTNHPHQPFHQPSRTKPSQAKSATLQRFSSELGQLHTRV